MKWLLLALFLLLLGVIQFIPDSTAPGEGSAVLPDDAAAGTSSH